MNAVLTPVAYLRVWAVWLTVTGATFFLCMMLGQGDAGSHGIRLGWPGAHYLRDARLRNADAEEMRQVEALAASIEEIRLHRVLAAAIVGMALAGAGVTLQAMLRNPLAEPYVLGISSGSAVGVLVWLLLTGPLYARFAGSPGARELLATGRSLPAVAGALVTCLAVFAIARRGWRGGGVIEPVTLLLVGVVVSAVNAAILMVVNALSPKGLKENLAYYMLGSISEGELTRALLFAAGVVLVVAYLPILFSGPALNVGTLSDTEATSLGISVGRLRVLCFVCASAMTGAALMLSGPIGFVGLICPHICRRIVGSDHRKLLVAAPLCGAAFLMAADTAVRVSLNIFGTEFPVGVVTALCGGPFFLFLLKRGGGTPR